MRNLQRIFYEVNKCKAPRRSPRGFAFTNVRLTAYNVILQEVLNDVKCLSYSAR